MSFLTQQEDGVLILVKVVPNASRDELSEMISDRLKVRVKSPPEAGKANLAVCSLVAKMLGLSKHQVSITSGSNSPFKTVRVLDETKNAVCSKLGL